MAVGGDDLGDGVQLADRGGVEGGGQVPLEQVAVAGQAVAGQRGAQLVQGGRPRRGRVLVVGLGGYQVLLGGGGRRGGGPQGRGAVVSGAAARPTPGPGGTS
ncbi:MULTISPECIES: hypothetical protein [unclassified Kitasatospora]|uniref:hypothetical protein n=1 Tax=unclassified Kitasatospora TaxID=2633591 RepID=UPI0033E23E00